MAKTFIDKHRIKYHKQYYINQQYFRKSSEKFIRRYIYLANHVCIVISQWFIQGRLYNSTNAQIQKCYDSKKLRNTIYKTITSEPNDSSIKRGNIKPHITLTTCKPSDVMVFNANFLPLPAILLTYPFLSGSCINDSKIKFHF